METIIEYVLYSMGIVSFVFLCCLGYAFVEERWKLRKFTGRWF